MVINITHILPVYARRDVTFSHGNPIYIIDTKGIENYLAVSIESNEDPDDS